MSPPLGSLSGFPGCSWVGCSRPLLPQHQCIVWCSTWRVVLCVSTCPSLNCKTLKGRNHSSSVLPSLGFPHCCLCNWGKKLASLPSECICFLCCLHHWVKKLLLCPVALYIGLLNIGRHIACELRQKQSAPYPKLAFPKEVKMYKMGDWIVKTF